MASADAKFTAVVVFPTPPFTVNIALIIIPHLSWLLPFLPPWAIPIPLISPWIKLNIIPEIHFVF